MALSHVSATQVKDFRGCARLWFWKNVVKKRPPQTVAQAKGTQIHSALEAHLKKQPLPELTAVTPEEILRFLKVLKPVIDRDGPVGLVEHKAEIETFPGGPKFVLVVDHAREVNHPEHGSIPQIDDLKTTSDFRYCKTPEELATDAQMVSYAKWALKLLAEAQRPSPNFVSVRHVYVRTKNKPVVTERVRLLSPLEIETQWALILDDVRAMLTLAETKPEPLKVMPNVSYCGTFGGCYFKPDCGIQENTIEQAFAKENSKSERNVAMSDQKTGLSLKERIAAMKAKTAASPETPAPTPTTPSAPVAAAPNIPEVLPPEAPARDIAPGTPPEIAPEAQPSAPEAVQAASSAQTPTEAPKRRGRPPKTLAKPPETSGYVASEPPVEHYEAKVTSVPVAEVPNSKPEAQKPKYLVPDCKLEELYIDCLPIRGVEYFGLGEDLLGEAGRIVAEQANVPDWRMISYTSRGELANAIRKRLDSVPKTLVVTSSMSGADVLIEVLSPLANKVVRALRG